MAITGKPALLITFQDALLQRIDTVFLVNRFETKFCYYSHKQTAHVDTFQDVLPPLFLHVNVSASLAKLHVFFSFPLEH